MRELRVDCDGDVVLYRVEPDGVVPHRCDVLFLSCCRRLASAAPGADAPVMTNGPSDPPAVIVARSPPSSRPRRKRDRPAKSYVVSLLDAGFEKVNAKEILEEARDLVEALPEGDARHTLFHMLVGLEAAGVPVDAIFGELRRRFGTSGASTRTAARAAPAAARRHGPATGNSGVCRR